VNVYAIPYRPDWARYLLAQAGYRDGLKVVLAFPERDRTLAALAKIVAGDLQQVGIDAQLAPMSTDEVLNLEKQVRRAGKPVLWLRRHGGE
jgi:ABC-type transport system substrate-binding protein